MRRLLAGAFVAAGIGVGAARAGQPVAASIASAVIRRNDPGPSGNAGEVVDGVRLARFNGAGGFGLAYSVSVGPGFVSEVYGSGSGEALHVLQRGFTLDEWTQFFFSAFELDDAGDVATTGFSRNTLTGQNYVWQAWNDGAILATQGTPAPGIPSAYFGMILDVEMTADGRAAFAAVLLDAPAGNEIGSVLMSSDGQDVLLKTGDSVSGLVSPVSRIDHFFAMSPDGSHWITRVLEEGSENWALVVDGAVAMVDGSPVIQNAVIPKSAGALGDLWGWFTAQDINDSGEWVVVGASVMAVEGKMESHGLVMKSGAIVLQDGEQFMTGLGALSAEVGGSAVGINAAGDWVVPIGLLTSLKELHYGLLVNGSLVMLSGDAVDLDGNGQDDDDASIATINDTWTRDGVAIEDRDESGVCRVALLAEARIGKQPQTTQGGFLMSVQVAPPPTCAADANGDLTVNGLDLSVLLSQFGEGVAPGSGADFNADGIVDGADLSVLLAEFGNAC